MKHLNKYFLGLLVACSLSACNDDEDVDNTPPTVSNITLNGESEGIAVSSGSELHFQGLFEDNIKLGQYKIDIHNNFDGHSHGRIKAPFTFSKSYALTGTSETVEEILAVPDGSTPGGYHFGLQYFDAAGNEGNIVVLEFEISDPANQPALIITSPEMTGEIEAAPGEEINVQGSVADPDGLAEVHIMIKHEADEHNHGRLKEEAPLFEKEIPLNGETSWVLNETVTAPAVAGHYELAVMAEDNEGHQKTVTAEMHIE